MSLASETGAPIRHADRFFIGGQWVAPSSDATIKVIDSGTEETYFTVAEAQAADISRAVEAAREAFDNGPWTGLSHAERAGYLRAIGAELAKRGADLGQIWPRQSGVLYSIAQFGGMGAQMTFDAFAGLADTFVFEEPAKPEAGQFALAPRKTTCSRDFPARETGVPLGSAYTVATRSAVTAGRPPENWNTTRS